VSLERVTLSRSDPSDAARNVLWRHAPQAAVLVVLFPGMAYPIDAPLLRFARLSALAQGQDVLELEYAFQAVRAPLGEGAEEALVAEVREVVERARPATYRRLLFVSKSLGTRIAPAVAQAAGLRVDHVLLTPVPSTIPTIEGSGAWVVAGDADPVLPRPWLDRLAQDGTLRLKVIRGGDHALEIPGDVARSLDALATTTTRVEEAIASCIAAAQRDG